MVNETLAKNLIAQQFSEYRHLPIAQILPGGNDHSTFRLGNDMTIRFPNSAKYAQQTEKEFILLPQIAQHVSLKIPEPVHLGAPALEYPFAWSVNKWIEGVVPNEQIFDEPAFWFELASFLKQLHSVDFVTAPTPGEHNFYRGGSLLIYDLEFKYAIQLLKQQFNEHLALKFWNIATTTQWQHPSCLIHGDVSLGNLICSNKKLIGVIDFGLSALGDPACDLAIAWSCISSNNRKLFRDTLNYDNETWIRSAAWALWKAAIIGAKIIPSDTKTQSKASNTINIILSEISKLI